MDNYEYMFIPINQIPKEIIDHYNLQNIEHKGKVYVEIRCGGYGLPQTGILTENQLNRFLGSYGLHHQTPHTLPPPQARIPSHLPGMNMCRPLPQASFSFTLHFLRTALHLASMFAK